MRFRCRRRTPPLSGTGRTSPTRARIFAGVQGCDATKIGQGGPAGAHLLGDLGVGGGDASVQVTDLGDEVDGEPTQGVSGGVAGSDRAQQLGRLVGVELAWAPRRGASRVSSTCSLFTVWVRVLTTSSRCSTSARKTVIVSSTATVWSPAAVSAAIPTEVASASSLLRPCPVDSIRTRVASLAGTSTATIRSAASQVAQGCAQPAGTLDRPSGGGPLGGELAQVCGSRLG